MDLYILPQDRDGMVAVLEGQGLKDVQPSSPYEPSVTYRASKDNAIVELIWGMKNHRAMVDEVWLARAETIDVQGIKLRLTPIEEMIWPKLYVLNRERTDWPDVLNLLHFCAAGIDWQHLLSRLRDDAPLLAGVICVLRWLSPDRVWELPPWVMQRLGLHSSADDADPAAIRHRARLLRPKDWFGSPMMPEPIGPSRE
jgi:hypothetical protein